MGWLTRIAEAGHSWLDGISSLGALAGLALVAAGYRWGAPVAGLAITLFICHVGYEVTRDMLARLTDGLDPGDLDAAQTAAAAVPGYGQPPCGDAGWAGRCSSKWKPPSTDRRPCLTRPSSPARHTQL